MRRYKLSIGLLAGLFLLWNCDGNPFISEPSNQTTINISLETQAPSQGLAKSQFIESANIRVTGPGMSALTKSLTVNRNTTPWRIEGKVDVKQGDSRKFEIEGLDAGSTRLFYGTRTVDLNEDKITLSIPITWSPFQVVYDDGQFNDSDATYAMESGTEFLTQFIPPILPVTVVGVRVYAADPLGYDFYYDIDFYNSAGDYIDTYDAEVSNSSFTWNDYDVSDMGLSFNDQFFVSLYMYDGPDGNGAYGPYVGLDTDSNGNSYYYLPSTGETNLIGGHWGLRIIVQVGGVTKEIAPTSVTQVPGHKTRIHLPANITNPLAGTGLIRGIDLGNLY